MFDGLRLPATPTDKAMPDAGKVKGPERAGAEVQSKTDAPERERALAADPEAVMRRHRTDALVRHARASDAILEAKHQGLAPSDEQRRELGAARRAFDEVRPHGRQDAEAAYSKDNSLAREAGSGRINRAVRALQLETEIRAGWEAETGLSPSSRADRFVARWQKLGQTSQRQYQAGDMSGYKSTRAEMGNMAKSLERDPQMESILANRRRELGIRGDFDSGRSLGRELAFTHGLDLGRGRGIGI